MIAAAMNAGTTRCPGRSEHQRRRFRILNLVDDVTRECLAAIPDISISGRRVARLIERRGKPSVIVSDHGTEFTSNAMLAWAEEHRVEWQAINIQWDRPQLFPASVRFIAER